MLALDAKQNLGRTPEVNRPLAESLHVSCEQQPVLSLAIDG
jgi:hypothetical protein